MWQYVKGFVIVTIEGLNLERFISEIARSGLYIFNVRRITSTKIEFYIYKKDFAKLVSVYRRSNYNIKVKRSIGIPFLMKRIYKRKSLLLGGIISLFILMILTTFITNVYIDAPEGINKDIIRQEIYKLGLKPWTNKYIIDKKDIRDKMLLKFDEIAHITINIHGTNAYVEIIKKEEEIREKERLSCNIIAKKNGIIEKVIARKGDALVKKGDIVKKGDVLIAGGDIVAKGEVFARTFYEVSQEDVYLEKLKIKTGNKKRIIKINIFDKTYSLKRNITYKDYIDEKKVYSIYKIPVEIEIQTFYEVNIKERKKDISVLKQNLRQKAFKKIDYLIPPEAKIVNKTENYRVDGYNLKFTVTIEVIENIGKEEKIKGGASIDNSKENGN
ncbi:similar to stage IV sporulation protein [Alkalithermobacter thermoalcaliphilus JW-YL-7 = DSM 7308]|uniref:Similar to stage IV sporulation protein n=1 Tax=Alkalithermobacter thermoalcaliphilus JW-YL-7 = DSM 7308 TaxID=1121328 RepID=A0A150FPX7_CLOPD|nr:sporulation protein YqfD [[Clostridium] paradoxum JW-YL-7 = DSM 7308]SHK64854.1 similar to stage IV sporulation protein [[Clostridium] paradoxum JW-YL-7 = DSM 7308]